MYAADQAGIKVIAPYVEALDPATGKWTRVIEDMGFPAGLARTMTTELTGKLPAGTRRIRIVNNLKIYWDAIRVDQTPDQKDVRVSEVPLADAALDFLGYPREIRLTPASDTDLFLRAPQHDRALCSRRRQLHALRRRSRFAGKSDDRFVVFSSGEGVKLDFDPRKLPPLPAGWIRDYFFYADGFEKDMDFYAAHAFTVEPLPRHTLLPYPYPDGEDYPADDDHLGYQLKYNTRPRSDRLPQDLRYHYQPNLECRFREGATCRQLVSFSISRISSNSFFFALSTFGNARSRPCRASTIAEAITRRANHLLSAGTMYQGACFVAVLWMASS